MPVEPGCRLDVWLWRARLFRSRARATSFCAEGRIRINRVKTDKAHHPVRPGDVLTFALGSHVRVLRVVALGTRRGPASEARDLYDDLDPPRLAASGEPAV